MKVLLEKLFDFFASIQLAVLIIIAVAVISAVGTFYESYYDAEYAQALVYHSFYMYFTLLMLTINLTCVMVDRWPWKKHHTGFILAHIGIILTLIGSLVTKIYGIDGSINFPIGETRRHVVLPDKQFHVYSSFADGQMTKLYDQPINIYKDNFKDMPIKLTFGDDEISVEDSYIFAYRQEEVIPTERSNDGFALRVQLQSSRGINMVEWFYRPGFKKTETYPLGPAKVIVSDGSYKWTSGNEIVFTQRNGKLFYETYLDRKKGVVNKGYLKVGDVKPVGWMDMEMRLITHYPQARRKINYSQAERPTPKTISALKLKFKDEVEWIGLNSFLRFFSDDKVYYISYANRRIDIGFDILLKEFKMDTYQGTADASSYESDVYVKALGDVNISMNNPMKHNGFTFYQASYEQDESGKAVASILSVNKDPGRWIKYLGSLLLVLGSIILFYFKRMKFLKKRA